jgi:nitrite reductase/ring-hydroxylating ferredoxin subunit
MRSRYDYEVPEEAHDLTHVEAGSPVGELLRRYWQPVCLSGELTDLPRKVRILCEDLVVFRDGTGRVGCLEPHCAHRGTSLEYGRIEERGIRCCYHGWLYGTDGKCIEMPCEQPGYAEKMDVWQPAYPVHEFGGLVFLYMGPPGKQPLYPMFDILDTRGHDDVVLRCLKLWGDHSLGFVRDCNWLQHVENALDPWHLIVLHEMISGDQFDSILTQGTWPEIGFEETALGMRYNLDKELPNGNLLERHSEVILPNIVLVANIHQRGAAPIWREKATEVIWCVPNDNETVYGICICAWPATDGVPDPDWVAGTDTLTDIRPGQLRERAYEDKQRQPDDMEAQEGQRRVPVHGAENLGLIDSGIAANRRKLRQAAHDVAEGRDPPNIIRDPETNRMIETSCWNTVVDPGETEAAE